MAIKERLLKQLNIVRDGLRAMPPFYSRDLQAMRNALLQARDLCFQGLSENRFAEYKDTYDGLLLAMEQLAADAPDKDEIVSLCSELLQYMVTQTQKETAFKKEIFFLPYKASMWDSLESVWKAADEDKEHCIAYVMPIPYADLTPEHTVAEWHCERELFPKDVPTVKWENFDLREIHPDIIFIHNPYDAYNRVTSVEARYYSDNLKKYTDKLVYIPYFVTGKSVMPHFCQTPGVLNADYVIVENEEIKRIYEENYPGGAPPEGKILALGSPKYDKVIVSKKEEYPLPETWEHLIEGREIILYNTSLQAHLMNPDYILRKLEAVLRFFKQHRKYAFWWRPHPLMEATLDSMMPQVASGYRELRDQYLQEHWGIYDDTPELSRAIVWSDVYYGDGSSVVELYRQTGKPVMIENLTIIDITKDDKFNLNFVSGVYKEDGFYFPAWNTNGLFRVKKDWSSAERIDFFPNQDIAFRFLYSNIIDYNNIFYFIPTNGKNIMSYEISKKKWECFILGEAKIQTIGPQFTNAHLIEDTIWLKPYCAHTIVSFHPDSAQISYFSEWFREIEREIGNETEPLFGGDVRVGTKLYFTFRLSNKVICFDTQEKTHAIYTIGSSNYKFESIAFDGATFWIYAQNGDLLQWDGKQKILRVYEDLFGDKRLSAGLLRDDDCLWVISSNKDDFACIDIRTGEVEMHQGYMRREIDIGYPSIAKRGNEILLYPNQGKYLIRIDRLTKRTAAVEILQTKEDYKQAIDYFSTGLKNSIDPNEIVYESRFTHAICPEVFYETFFNLVGERKDRKIAPKLCGASILHYMLSL